MKNYFQIVGDTCFIELNNNKFTMIDKQDFDKVNKFSGTWYADYDKRRDNWYVRGTQKNGKKIYLHRYIMDTPKDLMCDHINSNTLDNRQYNLRNVTNAENQQNQKGVIASNTSGYAGVHYDKRRNKWKSQIMVDGKSKFLGRFSTPEEAYKEYCKAKAKHHKTSYFARVKEVV